jgi:hypothetical protein
VRLASASLLAGVLMASLAPVSQAVTTHSATEHRPAVERSLHSGGLAVSTIVAAEAAARARAAADPTSARGTGIISGVVRTPIGSPAGSCVTAVGRDSRAISRTGPEGRYVLGGLRPGRYRLSASACANTTRASRHTLMSVTWTQGSTTVTVHATQVSTPAPISLWYVGKNWLAAPRRQTLPATDGARSGTGSISGRVTGRGRPQPGVCAVAISVGNRAPASALTTKSGGYRIGKLPPGRYVVQFVGGVQHCGNNGNWLKQWYPQVNSPYQTSRVKLVRVRAGRTTKGINASLKAGGEIAGTVRATSRKPISGICVSVLARIDRGLVEVSYNLTTNRAGRYALHGAFAGRYQVEFFIGCGSKGNYAFQWWRDVSLANRASTIRIVGTKKVTDANATLQPGATVTGVVKALTAKGKPVAGVCVSAIGSDTMEEAFATTAGHGGYSLRGLAAGRYEIQFDPTCIGAGDSTFLFAQRKVSVATGQTVAGFNAYLQVGGGISGLVTGPHGRPAGGVCVLVNSNNFPLTQTRPNGTYSISGVETGSFLVQFSPGCGSRGSLAPQLYHKPLSSVFGTPIRFRPNTITPNINVRMLPGGTLGGVVTDTAGHRLSRVCVSTLSLIGVDQSFATTRGGKYLIKNLPPGPYEISFGCAGYGTQFYPAQPTEATSSLVSVNAGVTTRVGARLRRAGVITGTVTISGGNPQQFACVEAATAGNHGQVFFAGITFTGRKGRYRLGGLAPERYLVQFSDCGLNGRFGSQWYRAQRAESAATPVKVVAGRTDRGINAVLTVGGSISGRITGPSGKPARAVCVIASSLSAQSAAFTQTGRSGRYRLNGLSTGRWSVAVSACVNPNVDVGSLTLTGIHVTAPHTVTGVNVKLPPGGSISGTVVSRDGSVPLSGTCVLAEPVHPSGGFLDLGITDRHGRYTVPQLAPGKYHVYFSDPVCGDPGNANVPFAPQWYRDRPSEASARTVRVSAGATVTGIDDTLSPFGAVTGTVETRGHAAVPGECVTAVPLGGTPPRPEVAITGRTGSYNLAQLAPGRYKIEFQAGCGDRGFATQWWDNAGSARSAKVITVGFMSISGIDATLRR